MGEHKTSMKLVLCLCVALFAAGALADVELVDGVVPEGLSAPEVVPEVELTEMEMDAEFEDAKASVNELLQAGKDDKACRNLAKTTAVEVNDSVAASQKAVANMPNGDQCNNEGAHLIKKAEDDKKKADKAEKDALNAVNAAKSAKINFGDYVVSSLDGKSCGYFYNTQVWKNAQNKIKNAETAYNKRKAEAQAAAKGVTAAKEEAKVLVNKCKCTSKTAIEKAIADANSKSKAANTAAWKKSYHMICVLDAKPANKCTVPPLPVVKPVPLADAKACDFTMTSSHTGCATPRGYRLEYLDRQNVVAYPAGSVLKAAYFGSNGCSGNNMRYKQWQYTDVPKPLNTETKYTSCTPFNGKQLQYLDRQWPTCGQYAAMTSFRVVGCGGSTKRYKYTCANYDKKYVGYRKWYKHSCATAKNHDLQYLDRQSINCPSNHALNGFGLPGNGPNNQRCGGNGMSYHYLCIPLKL